MPDIKDKILEYRQLKNWSQTEMAKKLDISSQLLGQYERGRHLPKQDFYLKWKEEFGFELTSETIVSEKEAPKSYQEQRFEKKLKGESEGVPVYVGNTRLGIVKVYSDDPEMQKPVANLPAEIFPGCNHGERVSGDSMYPLIINQGYVVGKIIDKRGIVWGEKYGLHTTYGISVVKFLHPAATPDKVRMVSYNKSIPDQDIPLDEITFIFRVMFILNPA